MLDYSENIYFDILSILGKIAPFERYYYLLNIRVYNYGNINTI